MRKRLKKKKRSCKLCKPFKMGLEGKRHISQVRRDEADRETLRDVPAVKKDDW